MFQDRKEAGRKLADRLVKYTDEKGVIILALPRGGVAVGAEIAKKIGAPLDVIITRKIRFPGEPEFAIGAIAENGKVALNDQIVKRYDITQSFLDEEICIQKAEIERRLDTYRGGKKLTFIKDKTVILVDDGVATGFTIIAAINALKEEGIKKLIVAVPVSPQDTFLKLKSLVDEIICLEIPEDFLAIGEFYYEFKQLTDEEVMQLIQNDKKNRTDKNI
ncbi:MAG: phosphoribosyltransferase [Planctomycetota bacterium]|jgi:predicted phosphoribosyltransferase